MATRQVHCEILRAGVLMGMVGMGLYAGGVGFLIFGGNWIRRNAAHWPAVRDLGWTFEIQGVAIAVGGAFSPHPWHPPMMLLVGVVSALVGILKREQAAERDRLLGAAQRVGVP